MSTPQQSLDKVTTTTVLGESGTLPRDMFDEFFQEVQDESVLLDRVRTVSIGRSKTRIPKIGVGERLRRGQEEGDGQDASNVQTGHVDIDAEKGSIYWDLTRETVEENPEREQLANTILALMAQQWSVDTEDLGINGDETSADAFVAQNNGWLEIAEARGAPTYSHDTVGDGTGEPQAVDSTLFHNAIQTMESKYLRADPVFVMNLKQLQEYAHHLTERETGLGDAVLFGDSELNPFGHDIIGTAMMPEDEAMLTPAQNLLYALRYDLRIEVVQDTDRTFDEDLFARYKIVGKDDFEIEDENAVVRMTNIESVSA